MNTRDDDTIDESHALAAQRPDRRLGRTSAAVFAVVVGLWSLNKVLVEHWFTTAEQQGQFGDMFGAVNALFSGLAFAGVVVAILYQRMELRESTRQFIASAKEQRRFYEAERRANRKEAAERLFSEWWGQDMADLRGYFYSEFLPHYYPRVHAWNFKRVEKEISEDDGRLRKLTDFFDRMGWLGAAGLVEVDDILGPMQHVVRRVWFATEPMIKAARTPDSSSTHSRFDPVFRLGFEWLFLRTEALDKKQAALLRHQFSWQRDKAATLQAEIEADEASFVSRLEALRGQATDA